MLIWIRDEARREVNNAKEAEHWQVEASRGRLVPLDHCRHNRSAARCRHYLRRLLPDGANIPALPLDAPPPAEMPRRARARAAIRPPPRPPLSCEGAARRHDCNPPRSLDRTGFPLPGRERPGGASRVDHFSGFVPLLLNRGFNRRIKSFSAANSSRTFPNPSFQAIHKSKGVDLF